MLIGAYERDNFGDVLFREVTEQLLSPHATVACAPFPSIDGSVDAYASLLREERFRAIWIVGGEVGGVAPADAFLMSAGTDGVASYLASNRHRRMELVQSASGGIEVPYMPRPSAYSANWAAPYVINSVGLAGLDRLSSDLKKSAAIALREADYVSVRDARSSTLLRRLGIRHALNPDVVHSIAIETNYSDELGDGERSGFVLFQISQREASRLGLENIVSGLLESPLVRRRELRLFLAGTAPGHDSAEVYDALVSEIRRRAPRQCVTVSRANSTRERVAEIRDCELWIGLSLHGRVVAGAYGRPRVGLWHPKLNEYASTWDARWPVGVRPRNLGDAVEYALSLDRKLEAGWSQRMGEQALSGVQAGLDRVLNGDEASRLRHRFASSRIDVRNVPLPRERWSDSFRRAAFDLRSGLRYWNSRRLGWSRPCD